MDSVAAATPGAELLFLADPDDEPELEALEAEGADYLTYSGGFAGKMNYGVRQTDRNHIFLGADDLHWHPGWYERATSRLTATTQIVGVNDLCSERVQLGNHATHFLVTREYALLPLLDGQEGPFSTAYHHWYCDDELVATAKHHDAIAFATDSIVEHYHPQADKAEDDSTYVLGRSRKHEDRRMFQKRSSMWTPR